MDLAIVGPVGVRRFTLKQECDEAAGHEHNYDHTTIVIRGRLLVKYAYTQDGVEVVGESREFHQGEAIEIKAKVRHTIKALEPNTQYMCVFSHRDFDGLVSQTYHGNSEAYE